MPGFFYALQGSNQSPLIPAKAGNQSSARRSRVCPWVPAFAGTSGRERPRLPLLNRVRALSATTCNRRLAAVDELPDHLTDLRVGQEQVVIGAAAGEVLRRENIEDVWSGHRRATRRRSLNGYARP